MAFRHMLTRLEHGKHARLDVGTALGQQLQELDNVAVQLGVVFLVAWTMKNY